MSRRIPPSTVCVRRIVSDILNMAAKSRSESTESPHVLRTVAPARQEFQQFLCLFAPRLFGAVTCCEDAIWSDAVHPTRLRSCSDPRPKSEEHHGCKRSIALSRQALSCFGVSI